VKKVYIIGIGFRPLDKNARKVLMNSEVVLSNERLLEAFKDYDEYVSVKDRIIALKDIHETKKYIRDNYKQKTITLLAAGDPMFFGIGRVIKDEIGKDAIEVFPDLSSVQVAFSKIREPSSNAFFVSFHGGPDPKNRRKLEHELSDLPALLEKHDKIGILTDKLNNPSIIAKTLIASFALPDFNTSSLKMFVCEKLGYEDEKITEGSPDEIALMSFAHPNVIIIKRNEA